MTSKALLLSMLLFVTASPVFAQDNSEDLRKVQYIHSKAQETDRLAAEALETLSSQRKRLEEDMMDAEDNPTATPKEAKAAMSEKLKAYKREESELLKKRKIATESLAKATQMLEATPKKRVSYVADFEKKNGKIEISQLSDNQQVTTEPVVTAADPIVERPKPAEAPATENSTPSVSEQDLKVAVNTKPKKEKKERPAKSDRKKEKEKVQEAKTEAVAVADSVEKTVQNIESDATPKPESAEGKPILVSEEKKSEILKGNLSGRKQKERAPKKPKKKSEKEENATEIAQNVQFDSQNAKLDTPNTLNTEGGETREKPTFEVAATPLEVPPTASTSDAAAVEGAVLQAEKKTKKSRSPKEKSEKTIEKVEKNTPSVSVGNSATYKPYDLKNDVYFNPPAAECSIAFDGVDSFTGKKKRETAAYRLFSYTDDIMRGAMKDKEFITCDIAATRIEGAKMIYLALTFTIQTKEAQKSFGFLDRGAFVIFRLINGKKLTFETSKTDIGIIDQDKNTTTYRAQLSLFDFVELTSSELDAVRVAWSAGYEDYEVYDLDVLKNMIKCLDKK